MDQEPTRDSLRLLLQHFSRVEDPRDPWRVRFQLSELLFLVTSASIAGCDDYDEIVAWGNRHLAFLRQHSEFYFGVPKEDWLRTLMNRIDPALFEAAFMAWVADLRPDGPEVVALDGKTLRRSHDTSAAQAALHLVSAWASNERLVLAQEAVPDKANEAAAIRTILERLPVTGALVTVDAIGATPAVATAIQEAGADYVLALKANQPSLHAEADLFFNDPANIGLPSLEVIDKDHGRLETRTYRVCHDIAWLGGNRRYPGEPRFPGLACLIQTTTRSEKAGHVSEQIRYYLSSAKLTPERAAQAIRGHWGIESLHWVLDVIFKEDLSRLRRGHGARNMALVRRFAFNLLRRGKGKNSLKTARKIAGWSTDFLQEILTSAAR
jgi:predicted transposase YbfD/YdcC